MEKEIELFPGSKTELETMTNKYYEAMKRPDGSLLLVTVPERENSFRGPPSSPLLPTTIEHAQRLLRAEAAKVGADALVHCTYPTQLFPALTPVGIIYSEIPAFGYAVKQLSYATELPC